MRAMMWKELRETAPWAILALVALGLTSAYAVTLSQRQVGGDLWGGLFQLWLTVGAPIVGAGLGLLQIIKDQKRDQWAFLIHRPVSRSVIFAGKAVAGLVCYLFAVGIPFGLTHVWASLPGSVPSPYDARLMLPGLADILGGAVFYFAGMLTALRPARWYGSRALPLPAALVSAAFVVTVPEFWQALLGEFAFAVMFALAAWGSFRASGDYAPQPKFARFALATTLLLGTIVTVAGGVALVVAFSNSSSRQIFRDYSTYAITSQGRVLRLTYIHDKAVGATDPKTGLPQPLPPGMETGQGLLPPTTLLRDGMQEGSVPGYRDSARWFTSLAVTSDTIWYYRDGRGLGYSRLSSRLTTYLGETGFAAASAPLPPRFPGPLGAAFSGYGPYNGEGSRIFTFPHAAYWVNLSARRLTLLAAVPPPQRIDSVGVLVNSLAPETPITALVLAAAGEFRAVLPDGNFLFHTPRAHDPQTYPNVEVFETPKGDRFFFWYHPRYMFQQESNPHKGPPSYICEVTANGVVQDRITLPDLAEPPDEPSSTAPLGLLFPPGTFAVGGISLLAAHKLDPHPEAEFWSRTRQDLHLIVPALWVSLVAGIVFALAVLPLGRRCGWGRTAQIQWAVGLFLLGGFGLLMLLSLEEWPAREPCPNCGRKRVVDRENCQHCGASFAALPPDGTEIFDQPAAAATVTV